MGSSLADGEVPPAQCPLPLTHCIAHTCVTPVVQISWVGVEIYQDSVKLVWFQSEEFRSEERPWHDDKWHSFTSFAFSFFSEL